MGGISYLAGGMLGDFIFQLSVIKAKYAETGKKGILYLSEKGDGFRFGLTNTFNDTYKIIVSQDYIEKYQIYNKEVVDVDLTMWRWDPNGGYKNWYYKYSDLYNIKWGQEKWLNVENKEKFLNKVIINTTHYRWPINLDFALLYFVHKTDLIFVSSDEKEYTIFKEKTGLNIEYYKPTDFNDICSIIHACKLFIGSQSAPLHIAIAMQKTVVIGECREENHPIHGNYFISGLDSIFPNIFVSVLYCCIDQAFDWQAYLNHYPDLSFITTQDAAWMHWIYCGKPEGRKYFISKSLSFDWKSYLNHYPDLSFITTQDAAWQHWIHCGKPEGRQFFSYL